MRIFSLAMVVLGVAILVSTIAAGGGPLSFGLLLGLVFCGVGGGRLFLVTRGRR